jgi:hypothetical protein
MLNCLLGNKGYEFRCFTKEKIGLRVIYAIGITRFTASQSLDDYSIV